MKNFKFKVVGNLLVSVYNENPPTNEEAEAALESFRQMTFDRLRALSFTKGGTHTAAQRKQLNDVLAGRELKTAVVTDVRLVRGVVTAMSWFNKSIKVFTPETWEDAFAYLEIPPGQFDRIWEVIKGLDDEIQRSKDTSSTRSPGVTRPPSHGTRA
jgi:hypothetical protein